MLNVRRYNNEAGLRAQVESDAFDDDGDDGINTVGTRFTPTVGAAAGFSPNLRALDTNKPYRTVEDVQFTGHLEDLMSDSGGIFGSIARIISDIYNSVDASNDLIVNGSMKSSGVDTYAITSLMVSIFTMISKEYCNVNFLTYRSYDDGGNLGAEQVLYPYAKPVGYKVDFRKFDRFYSDISSYLSSKRISDIPDGNSPLRDLLVTVKNNSIRHRKPATDFVVFCRALADEIDSKAQSLISSFKEENGANRVDLSFLESEEDFEKILDYSQINVARNWIESLKLREGANKYFDNFFASKAEESFFYTMTRDARFTYPKGDNLRMMAIGIPHGFTKSVLGIDPLLNPSGFVNNRKIKISVSKYDVILGNSIETEPKEFIFDLNTFFKEVTDPSDSSNESEDLDSPRIITGDNRIDISKAVIDRPYPSPDNAKDNITFQNINLIRRETSDVRHNANGSDQSKEIFENHLDDYLAKTYIKIAYGIDLSEKGFFIDYNDEKQVTSKEERKRMNKLVDAHLKQTTGQDLTIDSYLAGNRRTREIHDRLKEGKRTKPAIDAIDNNVDGVSPESLKVVSDDMVTFTQMMGENNPFISPSSTRHKITKPKLFERVFCIMIDPDDFEIDAASISDDDELTSTYIADGKYKDIKRADEIPQASQFQVTISSADEG